MKTKAKRRSLLTHEIEDPRECLEKQMARDPEGHFFETIAGDRRLPPWFGSEAGSAPPPELAQRLLRFFQSQDVGSDGTEHEIRHNWYDKQIELIRWMPDFLPLDPDEKISLVSATPLTLYQWEDRQGWLPHGEGTLDFIRSCFSAYDEDPYKKAKYKAGKEAWVVVNRLCSIVSQGIATDLQLEEYEAALKIADPDGWQKTYELAEEMRAPAIAMMDELGV